MTMISKQRQWILGIASVGLAVTLIGVTGCTSMKRMAQGNPGRTAGQVKDDKNIKAQIEDALVNAPVYKFPDVTVNVFNGEVALSGFVVTQAQKDAAVRIAQDVRGVTDVNNQLVLVKNPGYPIVGQALPPDRSKDQQDHQ